MRINIQRKYMNLTLIIILLSIAGLNGCQAAETKKFQASKSDYGSRPLSNSELPSEIRMYGATAINVNHHENTKLAYSRELSTALSDMSGIRAAIVMVTDKNAYAAFTYTNSATGLLGNPATSDSNNPDNLSMEFMQQIALTIRKKSPQLDEVYMSANREFINQMNVYYSQSFLGVNLNDYVQDFNNVVKQHFPAPE